MDSPRRLRCTACGREYPLERTTPRCGDCGEPLDVVGTLHDVSWPEGGRGRTLLETWRQFLPFEEIDACLSLGEGFTPLVASRRAGPRMGVERLYFKNEAQNPTWSFKDRGTIAGLQYAVSRGFHRIGAVSTGNMAVSVAAYGARAGLESFILVSAGLPPEKIAPIAVHGPTLIRVEGDYGRLYSESLRLGEEMGICFINSDVPMRVEGSKTIAFELWEQLNGRVPDFVIVPTSAGGNLRGIIKGFRELERAGGSDRLPTFVCAQAAGCAPIHRAFHSGGERIERFENPNTIAHAIENPTPPSGNEVLRQLRATGGLTVAVDDPEIIGAQLRLAGEGIFAQPAGAVSLAAAARLAEADVIGESDTVVCVVTGGGLKYTAALNAHNFPVHRCRIDELEHCL